MGTLKVFMTGLIAFGKYESKAIDVAALVNQLQPIEKPVKIHRHQPFLWLGKVDHVDPIKLSHMRVEIEPGGARDADSLDYLPRLRDVGAGTLPRNDIFDPKPDLKRVVAQVQISHGHLEVHELVTACFADDKREVTQILFARSQQKPPQKTAAVAEVVVWKIDCSDGCELKRTNLETQKILEPIDLTNYSEIWITNSPDPEPNYCHDLRRPGKENAHFYAYQKFVSKGKHFYPDAVVAHVPMQKIEPPNDARKFLPGPISVNNRPMCPPVRF